MFSRIGRGKFSCPTCFTVCHSFDEISTHLFCELESDNFEEFNNIVECTKKKVRKNEFNRGVDYEVDEVKYGFIFTNSSPENAICAENIFNELNYNYVNPLDVSSSELQTVCQSVTNIYSLNYETVKRVRIRKQQPSEFTQTDNDSQNKSNLEGRGSSQIDTITEQHHDLQSITEQYPFVYEAVENTFATEINPLLMPPLNVNMNHSIMEILAANYPATPTAGL